MATPPPATQPPLHPSADASAEDAQDAKDREVAKKMEEEHQALANAADAAAKAAAAAQERVRQALAALENERAAAAAECEAAAARLRAAPPPPKPDHGDADDLLEAATIANLHAQAASIQNIRALVPVVLDPLSTHYNRWRDLVILALERYSLDDHVLLDAASLDVPAWWRMDAVVWSWLFGTLTAELMETVRVREDTARVTWVRIEEQFRGNRETRALQLDAVFRLFEQGDLSITDYCRRMKSMADDLGDLGEVIQDRTLVLNVLRGLNERYSHMVALLKRSRPFPTFDEVRNDLLLEELTINSTRASSTSSTALVASAAKPSASAPASQPSSSTSTKPANPSGNSKNKNRRKNGNKGSTPWPSFYNPWTGTITMWPGPQQQKGGQQQHQQFHAPQQGSSTQQQALLAAAPYSGAPFMLPGYPGYPVAPQPSLSQQPQHPQLQLQPAAPVQPMQQQQHAAPASWSPWGGTTCDQ